ncbi:MAG: PilZ domain-containing protein [Terriglobales bacterium]
MSKSTSPQNDPAAKGMRRFTRYPVDIRITVNVFRSGNRFSLWGRSNEFGQDGIGATLTGELETGEVVSLDLDFPMVVSTLKIRAVVRYRDGLRHGFEFLTRTPIQTETIRHICEQLALRQ